MQLISREIPLDCELILMGDDHEGNICQHKDGVRKVLEYVLEKPESRFIVHHGDEMEGITVDDPRYDSAFVDPNSPVPLRQMDAVISKYSPVAKQMVTMVWGNHPMKLRKFGNLTKEICRKLEIPYGSFSCKIHYTNNGKTLFKHFVTHGTRSIMSGAKDNVQRQANQLASLKRLLENKAGDCVLMSRGHTHKLMHLPPMPQLYLTDDGKRIKQHYTSHNSGYIMPELRWYVSTGSFLKNYGEMGESSYSEVGEYDPIVLGYAIAHIQGGKISHIEERIV